MRSTIATVSAFALLIGACQRQRPPSSADQTAALQLTPYTLEVMFDGLIAFVEDGGTVWALLVDADYDVQDPSTWKDELPPCVLDQFEKDEIPSEFPPHKAHILFRDAKVTGADPVLGRAIALEDIRLETGRDGFGQIDLTSLTSKEEVAAERMDVAEHDVQHLDKIASRFLGASLTDHLAARVLIQGADSLVSRPLVGCPIKYSFVNPTEDPEVDCTGAGRPLAEEVLLVQNNLTTPVEIRLLTSGDTVTVEPEQAGGTVRVEIVNIRKEFIGNPNIPPCDVPERHPMAYRWYYLLMMDPPSEHCADHFFPCEVIGDTGGRKCPQKEFIR